MKKRLQVLAVGLILSLQLFAQPGPGTWNTVGSGMPVLCKNSLDGINDAKVFNNELWVCGNMETASAPSTIWKWNGTAWTDMTLPPNSNFNTLVPNIGNRTAYCMQIYNSELYLGGAFGLLKWNGSTFSFPGNYTIEGTVFCMKLFNNSLYLGGDFMRIFDPSLYGIWVNEISLWNGTTLGPVGLGFAQNTAIETVISLEVYNGDLYASGKLSQTSAGAVLDHVAKYTYADNLWVNCSSTVKAGNLIAMNNKLYSFTFQSENDNSGSNVIHVFDGISSTDILAPVPFASLIAIHTLGNPFLYNNKAYFNKWSSVGSDLGNLYQFDGTNFLIYEDGLRSTYEFMGNASPITGKASRLITYNSDLFMAGNFDTIGQTDIGRHIAKFIPANVGIGNSTESIHSSIYPNPSSGEVNVTFEKPLSGTLQLYDITGRVLYSQLIDNQQKVTLQRNNIEAGMYLINFEDNQNGKQILGKVLFE